MRRSNYVFTKGSIVFVKFPPSSDKAFLNGRPLIVVSNPTHIINTLVVCTTGTQDKPGIEVSLWNHFDKCYVGDTEVSKIYPYSMLTIYDTDIVSSIGQLDPFIMKKLDGAIDFHLGRSDEIPGYLKNCEEYLCGVTYNTVSKKYLKEEGVNSKFKSPYNYRNEPGKPSSRKQPTQHQISDDEILAWANAAPTSDLNIAKIYKDPSKLINTIDERSVNLIVSRVVPISLIAKKYSIGTRIATFLRISLTNIAIRLGVHYLNGDLKANDSTAIPDYVFIGMILAKAFSNNSIKNATNKYDADINRILHHYNINTDDRRTWKSLETHYCE